MSRLPNPTRLSVACVLCVGLICASGCAIRLAPSYDRTVVTALSATTEELMTFFASVSSGTDKATFSERKPSYDSLIGKLDAIKIQSAARPVPRSQFEQLLGLGPKMDASPQALQRSQPPSVAPVDLMSRTIVKMRDTDSEQGVTAIEVAAFKQQIAISMDQALTYEKALER